jgi:uncharacterized membrane protein YkvA (DUF1232 family)
MLDRLKASARALKREVLAVYLAAKDPRTPWYAKGLIFLIVAYALSPIDLIPDFIPVLGYLDDLILIPAGIWLAIRMVPPEVLVEARETAATQGAEGSVGKLGAVIIVFLWILFFIAAVYFVLRLTKRI